MNRRQVFQWRLAASATLLLLVFGMIRLLWYPGEYFAIFGVRNQVLLLVLASLLLGPALSAIVYVIQRRRIAHQRAIFSKLISEAET